MRQWSWRGLRTLVQFHPVRWKSSNFTPIGTFDELKEGQRYAPGQLFVHKVFGYRGIILAPWSAHLYDRNQIHKPKGSADDPLNGDQSMGVGTTPTSGDSQETKPLEYTEETYYQTLIHNEDISKIPIHKHLVTFLGRGPGPELFLIPGHDYAHHNDVLAYQPFDNNPIVHPDFYRFFELDQTKTPPWCVTTKLHDWMSNNRWTEMRNVHQETTEDVRITVMPFYLGERSNQNDQMNYWWRYIIRMENLNTEEVQLRSRHWEIVNFRGHKEVVRGDGVVGEEPVLSVYQYSSYVTLPVPGGHMWGSFTMQRKDGSMFDVRVPAFELERNDALER